MWLDSTTALSQDFSHLSVDNPDASIGTIDIPRVSPERDTLSDDDHKALDAKILTTFSANKKINQEPHLPSLLWNIVNDDARLRSLTSEVEGLLKDNESIKTALRKAWQKGAFREVRQLGSSNIVLCLFILSVI